MDPLASLAAIGKELGLPVAMAVVFIGVILASQRAFGSTFEQYRSEATAIRAAQTETNKTMLDLMTKMRSEINAVHVDLEECKRKHAEDHALLEAQEVRLYKLQLALSERGIQAPSDA